MIADFTYSTPTKLIFGKGVVEALPQELGKYGKRVLMTYGGGSIKKLGLYDQVITKGKNLYDGKIIN